MFKGGGELVLGGRVFQAGTAEKEARGCDATDREEGGSAGRSGRLM
jgi:hypothetical protein